MLILYIFYFIIGFVGRRHTDVLTILKINGTFTKVLTKPISRNM